MTVTTRPLPRPGQTVRLDATAAAEYARDPFLLEVTDDPLASSLDAAQRRSPAEARWVLLTGWRLDARGRRDVLKVQIPARRDALIVVPRPSGRRRGGAG